MNFDVGGFADPRHDVGGNRPSEFRGRGIVNRPRSRHPVELVSQLSQILVMLPHGASEAAQEGVPFAFDELLQHVSVIIADFDAA